MLIYDLKKDFYLKLNKEERVLLLSSCDVDAICAAKIIQWLFRTDHIAYTYSVLTGRQDLERAFLEHSSDQTKTVVLINCGATIGLIEFLSPRSDVIFYVVDNLRPVHLENIYDESGYNYQVRCIVREGADLDIPEFERLFLTLSDDEEDDTSGDEFDEDGTERGEENLRAPSGKRARMDMAGKIARGIGRKEKVRRFEQARNDEIFEYNQHSYYAVSSAFLIYELAVKLSKDNNELLWWSIVGLTDLLLTGKLSNERYIFELTEVQNQVSRHNQRSAAPTENGTSVSAPRSLDRMKISFIKNEMMLLLYRKWTIYDSLQCSLESSCRLRVWTTAKSQVKAFIADLGIPLKECRQAFGSMRPQYQQNFRDWVEGILEKYRMRDTLPFPSFEVQYGYNKKFGAADVSCAIGALLELGKPSDKELSLEKKCMVASDCLSKRNIENLQIGMDQYKHLMKELVELVRTIVGLRQVTTSGKLFYVHLKQSLPHFSYPNTFRLLARYALQAWVSELPRGLQEKGEKYPLVLSMPSADPDWCLMIGIPPLDVQKDTSKNLFNSLFENVANAIGFESFRQNYFDTSVVEIKMDVRIRFLNRLASRILQ